jgi:hypothetical protein
VLVLQKPGGGVCGCALTCQYGECEVRPGEIKINNSPRQINDFLLKCLKVNRQEQELIEKAVLNGCHWCSAAESTPRFNPMCFDGVFPTAIAPSVVAVDRQ